MKKQKSPWRWPLRIVVIGCALYFSRSFWPMFFQGEPYAEIEATIPPDMTLRVGASYRSSSCTEMTFSDFSQIPGGKGWSKEYTPDSQGKVKAKVYQRAIGPCNWYLTDFGIDTVYHKIPANVLTVSTLSNDIKKEMAQHFSDASDISHRTASLSFNIDSGHQSNEYNNINNVTLNTNITPSIMQIASNYGGLYYDFSYEQKRVPNELYKIEGLDPYGRKESLKINYHVDVSNYILFKEFYPSSDKNTSKIIQ
ncbi:conserved hypothetical protein [Enterobacterales bacterium 8AC]|nr:conserved hypothetical protein [Enterobacterales bacterium 8AC]